MLGVRKIAPSGCWALLCFCGTQRWSLAFPPGNALCEFVLTECFEASPTAVRWSLSDSAKIKELIQAHMAAVKAMGPKMFANLMAKRRPVLASANCDTPIRPGDG
ncbi:hypothetical protein [Glutamicibacter arilaitensis]|uniref:hypothetical protein n=1 Tax=Glutamicibacter arilaitensis TaxID=256701 RepID=UPI003F8DFE7F